MTKWLSLVVLTALIVLFVGCSQTHSQAPPPSGFATWEEYYEDFNSKPSTSVAQNTVPNDEASSSQPISLAEARVTRIVDGDTIEVSIDGASYKVRYIGIDTAEVGDPCSAEATAANRQLVEGETVRLEKDISETDRYGRLLRYVYVGDTMVNAELVRQGFAQVYTYPPDVKYNEQFLDLQRQAREAERGCWAIETPPEETSKNEEVDTGGTGQFVGSVNSDVYHYPTCSSAKKIKPANEIWFDSVADAKAHGYRPCKNCNPPG